MSGLSILARGGGLIAGSLPGRILDGVQGMRAEWIAWVEALVRCESPTTSAESQRAVQDFLEGELRPLGFRLRRLAGVRSGGVLLGRGVGVLRGRGGQLLLGHSDTVWPIGTLARLPARCEGERLAGPGSFDMKAGLANALLALRVLEELGERPVLPPVLLVNSDEETGSADSIRSIRRWARVSDRVFVLEPALGLAGQLKTRRKGVGRFQLRVLGRGAHSGLDPGLGISAIQELAILVQALHALSDPARGIVVNVGEIQGGVRANVIAPEASAKIDVRVVTEEDGREVAQRILALTATTPGCTLEVVGGIDRPPMERTPGGQILWEAARAWGGAMGLDLAEGLAGGGSDGNHTALLAPTLDGLGAVGDGAHADHEFVEIGRTLERAALLAGLLLHPPIRE